MNRLQIDDNSSYIPSQFKAALKGKCPHCRTGNMFPGRLYEFKVQKMNQTCPHCGFFFEREPGYFYVAMFVSYAMNVALLVSLGIATYVLTGSDNPWIYILTLLMPIFFLSPVIFRYSRVILLYWLTPGVYFDVTKAGTQDNRAYRTKEETTEP